MEENNEFQTSLEKALNLVPIGSVVPKANYVKQMEENANDDSAVRDFQSARENIVNIIDLGTVAIKDLANLAGQSQDPGHYNVLAILIKNLSDTSDKLLKTHESIEKIINKRGSTKANKESGTMMISTAEISKMIKEASNNSSK